MTTITQICAKMIFAQTRLQDVAAEQRRMHAIPALNDEVSRSDVAFQSIFCHAVLEVAAARLTRFAAANDNTMVMGVA